MTKIKQKSKRKAAKNVMLDGGQIYMRVLLVH